MDERHEELITDLENDVRVLEEQILLLKVATEANHKMINTLIDAVDEMAVAVVEACKP